ncbi:hypothetical protein C8R47DRAFT_1329923, partial [Mycena vitilis]
HRHPSSPLRPPVASISSPRVEEKVAPLAKALPACLLLAAFSEGDGGRSVYGFEDAGGELQWHTHCLAVAGDSEWGRAPPLIDPAALSLFGSRWRLYPACSNLPCSSIS